MKIVVDSNIVFSAILNTRSNIGQLIINGSNHFDFYTVGLLKEEILNHQPKIQSISRLSDDKFREIYQLIIHNIKFIDDILISGKNIEESLFLVENIDGNDVLFVTLANHLHCKLWTGDKKLISGLKKKGFVRTINTDDLLKLYFQKEQKRKEV